jgi:hypothetical protein
MTQAVPTATAPTKTNDATTKDLFCGVPSANTITSGQGSGPNTFVSLWSEREMDVVRLACFRYLSRSAIVAFLFEGSALKPHSMEVQTGRILDRLKAAGLVASTQRLVGGPGGGSGRLVYFLTHGGQKLADRLTGAPPRRPPQNGSFLTRAHVHRKCENAKENDADLAQR